MKFSSNVLFPIGNEKADFMDFMYRAGVPHAFRLPIGTHFLTIAIAYGTYWG